MRHHRRDLGRPAHSGRGYALGLANAADESEDGYFWLAPLAARAIPKLKIEPYPLLDENNAAIGLIVFGAFMTHEKMVELDADLAQQSPEQRGETLRGWWLTCRNLMAH